MRESSWRRLPAAALRGLAKGFCPFSACRSFKAAKSALSISTSPRISISSGMFSPCRRRGMLDTVLTFWVTSSPVVPSPRVAAWVNTPSRYSRLMARPSNLGSITYSGFSPFNPPRTRSSKAYISAWSNTPFSSCGEKALVSDSIGISWRTSAKPAKGSPPTRWVGLSGSLNSG